MKTKNSEIAVKIFLVVVGVILVGLLIAWSTGVFKDKKNDLSRGTEKINNVIGSMSEFDLLVYEGESIKGDTIIDLISDLKEKDLDITVYVKTNKGTEKDYTKNNQYKDLSYSKIKTDDNYINPNGRFKAEVIKNANGIVESIKFTQQK